MFTPLATIVSGVIGVGIVGLGARFLLAPQAAAAGYGVSVEPAGPQAPVGGPYPWLYVKGVRDIASGLFLWILLLNRAPHLLGAFMIAASLIPVGDAMIVLRSGGEQQQRLAEGIELKLLVDPVADDVGRSRVPR